MEKPKCEEIGFEHLWENAAFDWNIVTLAQQNTLNPVPKRICKNCGKKQEQITEWRDIPDEVK